MPVDDATSYEDHYPGSFIPFDRFLKQVRLAKYEDYKHTKVRNQQAFNEMKAHILKMYEGVTKATSFVLQDEHADCIAIHEQPTVYHLGIKDIPPPPVNSTNDHTGDGNAPGNTTSAESPLKLGKKDRFCNPISCPKTSIPMARLTLEKLTQHPTLNDFFSKPPMDARPQRPEFSADEIHVHAYGIQYVQNFGGNSWLDLWNPTGDFTISQQWYQGYASGQPLQSLEGGWVSENSDNSRLFIYYTADGYGKLKCWNLDCPAFVQINHNWYLGGPWDHYSTKDGDQWGFALQWKFYQGNWWLFLQGPGAYEAVGYYNQTIWNGGQMTHNASVIIYGGEVANYTGGENFPQMGSGDLAEKGWREAAFQKTIFWIPRDENDGVGVWANLTANDEGKSSCYTIDLVNWPNGGDWGTYFYFGGPGGNDCPL
ncbi:uncharacterized protein BDZ99DRAFT_384754 [Mytilinidion resinicola]|uniref:Neprosin PEP catalytic domain-containing protein n=1 Tax=Mytilinidion resinicola TaxID=574789 RepID=A0A6A6YST1_9PEZI|nr:uncharacterized protein BDZ99DRAFT_384754 [Mytilinidion resinicola]KAF2811579.1 hypothetical protein BDZ99DRAFT_384754 [Mytilinidion resinicola]